ncbi:hypothetical protein OIU79_008964, partial [Salix purpurea]
MHPLSRALLGPSRSVPHLNPPTERPSRHQN